MSYDLAVVPIFVNAGAAILPAMAAGMATFVALLFKPKELIKACRTKPAIPTTLLLIGLAIWALIHFWPTPAAVDAQAGGRGSAPAASMSTGGVYVDWTEIALARIKAKSRGDFKAAETSPVEQSSSAVVVSDEAVIFRGSFARLGATGAAPQGALEMVWDYFPSWVDFDGTVVEERDSLMLSSPVVHGGRVYAASCTLDPPNSYGILFCVDATTGETVWSVDQIDGEELIGFFSSPAITADGKSMLIGQGLHPDSNCNLICLDTATGAVRWTVVTPLHFESSPAIEDGVVYIGAGAIEDPKTRKPKGHGGYVIAVRIEDGKELWRYDVADPESSPIVEDGVVYIGSGFSGQAVVALRTGTDEELAAAGASRELWSTSTPYPITGAVTKVGDRIIVGGGNGDFVFRDPNPAGVVLMLDAGTGDVIWETPMPDAVLGAVAAADYFVAPVASGLIVALDPETGDEVWSTPISGQSPVLSGASVAGDSVYAVSSDGYMVVLDLKTGKETDRVYINDVSRPGEQGLCISSPVVYQGRVYVGTETGGLRSYAGQ
ncbi:MAG: PQQ-binding-like beta-propeller repeat protein [Opitutaceae bacterium]